jgi:hypothetical protein
MISMTKGRSQDAFHAVVLVAFDRTTGRVHGTFVHGSLGGPPNEADVQRSDRFLADLSARLGGGIDLDVLRLPLEELKEAWVDSVDPGTRMPIESARNAAATISRP